MIPNRTNILETNQALKALKDDPALRETFIENHILENEVLNLAVQEALERGVIQPVESEAAGQIPAEPNPPTQAPAAEQANPTEPPTTGDASPKQTEPAGPPSGTSEPAATA